MLSKAFLIATLERAIKSSAQAVVLGLSASDAGPVNAFQLDYKGAIGFAVGGAVLSVLTSLMSAPIGNNGPSLANEKIDA
jgi:Putative lactococcus lactis phage r1t holin